MPVTDPTAAPKRPFVLPDWRILARQSNAELAKRDIAVTNLACAAGLPGWEKVDPELCVRTLDEWAEKCRAFTDKWRWHFEQKPVEYGNSEGFFKVMAMVTHLQRDLGVLYNPLKISEDVPFDLEDTFIHGIIQGNGGTCATMPVVYAAVGRRLGYPIKLVTTWVSQKGGHGLARWAGESERFNIEAAGTGLNTPPDDYYRRGRYAEMTPEIERLGCYLQSKTPRMELAFFITERSIRWRRAGNFRAETDALAWAVSLHPEDAILENTLKLQMNAWIRAQNERRPSQFPQLWIKPPSTRLWPGQLALEYERKMLGLIAAENLLTDRRLEPVWEGMRRGQWNRPFPTTAMVDFSSNGRCDISFHNE